jgi:hypothetical protein
MRASRQVGEPWQISCLPPGRSPDANRLLLIHFREQVTDLTINLALVLRFVALNRAVQAGQRIRGARRNPIAGTTMSGSSGIRKSVHLYQR